jgi:hypothetical protein
LLPSSLPRGAALSALLASSFLIACDPYCRDTHVAFAIDLETVDRLQTRYGSQRLPEDECEALCREADDDPADQGGNGQGSGKSWSSCELIRIDTDEVRTLGILCEGAECGF